jgi:hypothetical protein
MQNFVYCSDSCKWLATHNDTCIKYGVKVQHFKRGNIRCVECASRIRHIDMCVKRVRKTNHKEERNEV